MVLSSPDFAAWDAALALMGTRPTRFATPGDLAKIVDPATVQTPALDLIDQAVLDAYATPNARLIISLPPQEGKALALDTPIATPSGWTTMGELQPGDELFDRRGNVCHITWVSPVWTGRDCYIVTTGDGERIVADAAHEWFARLDRRSNEHVVESTVLAAKRSKHAQILAGATLALPEADLPIDPYVLGAWLGDGDTNGAAITSHIDDVAVRDRIEAAGWPLRHTGRYRWSFVPDGWPAGTSKPSPFRVALTGAGVFGNKHIPVIYLRASAAQRLALLQGLIDTDGHVLVKGQVEFCSTLRVLAEGVRELAYSLGAKAVMTTDRAMLNGRDCGPRYRVRFYLADAAHLPRKAERCKDSSVARVRYVTAERCASVSTVCIEVDSPDHSYLAGRTLLPTHNSQRVTKTATLWALLTNPDRRIAIASYSQELSEGFSRDIRNWIATFNGEEGTTDLGLRIARDNGAARRWQLAGHKGGVRAVGLRGSLTGRPVDALIIDDPIKDAEQADSQYYRDFVWGWWQATAGTRFAPGAPVILILTRWHEDDLAGRLLSAEDAHVWKVINIPAIADHDPDKGQSDALGRSPGEWLTSARKRTVDEWKATRTRVGSRVFNALYQGRPSPATGDILQRSWWRRFDTPIWSDAGDARTLRLLDVDEAIISCDMTFKDTRSSDFVVMQVWCRRQGDVYLVDQIRKRLSFTATLTAFEALVKKWPDAHAKLVEDKANGTAVIDMLRKKIPGIIPITPHESKIARTSAVAPFVESGNVRLPADDIALFNVGDFIEEATSFPNGAHDDQVDGASQAIARLLLRVGSGSAYQQYMKRTVGDAPVSMRDWRERSQRLKEGV